MRERLQLQRSWFKYSLALEGEGWGEGEIIVENNNPWIGRGRKAVGQYLATKKLAEREGFEPSVGLTLRRFSKPVPSATRPPLRDYFLILFQWVMFLRYFWLSTQLYAHVLLRKLLVIREKGRLSQEEVKFKSDSFFVLNCRL